MKWVLHIVGLLIGGIGGAGGVLYLVERNKTAAETDVVFAQKNFYDTEEMIGASGTMTGASIAYPNNSYSIGCYRDRKECWLTSVEQIGRNLMGRMDAPYAYENSKCPPDEV